MVELKPIDHTTLANLVEAGAVRGVQIIGQKGGWAILVKCGLLERPLAAQRSGKVRVFKRLESLTTYLRSVGIARFEVDATDYDPTALRTPRPDRAAAMRHNHEAVRHDAWFRKEVEQSLREADDPNTVWVSNAGAKGQSSAQRARWLAQG
ncbi:MAG: hypothetical protein SGI99_01880 [Pseudomonadota bacterium]|nr:hypothetical protein [Pseudomonadota bacterium]